MVTSELKTKLGKTIDALGDSLRSLRVGRASADLVENIQVKAYDSTTPLQQVASIQTPSHDQIVIQPWDPEILPQIMNALDNSDLGFSPFIEGNIIRISLPPLTSERRDDFVKQAHKYAEDARIAVRRVREEVQDEIDKTERDKKISEDEKFRQKDELQKIVDEYNKKIKELVGVKEKDILEG